MKKLEMPELTEVSIVMLMLLMPLPIFTYLLRFAPGTPFLTWGIVLYYLLTTMVVPSYLTARTDTVYRKALLGFPIAFILASWLLIVHLKDTITR